MLSFQVKDRTSGDPVAGVNVKIGAQSVVSDASGTVSFTEPADVTTTQVTISHASYKSVTLPLTQIIAGGTVSLERSGDLDAVVITPGTKKNLLYLGFAVAVYYALRHEKII